MPQRNFAQEAQQALGVMQSASPTLLELARQYDPGFAEAGAAAAGARSRAETELIANQADAVRDAMRQFSPTTAAAEDAIGTQLEGIGPSAIESELRQQALDELRLGGQLSPDEQREVTQGARAAFSARGMEMSNPAMVGEVLARTSLAEARRRDRQQFAAGVDNQSNARQAADRNFANTAFLNTGNYYDPQRRVLGPSGTSQTASQYSFNTLGGLAGQAGNAAASNQAATVQAALAQLQHNAALQLQQNSLAQDQRQFDLNRQDTLANQSANRTAGLFGGLFGGLGSALGGLFS